MEIKITIRAPSKVATRVGLLLGVPLVILAGSQWVARADYQPQGWADQEMLSAKKMNSEFEAIRNEFGVVRSEFTNPLCPAGYEYKGLANFAGSTLCTRGTDEVVRVGTGASAFWIDRYEASLWEKEDGTGQPYGINDDLPGTFPRTGQYTSPLYARSISGANPSRFVTWFQANAACRASGKRLPTDAEWLFAGTGTPDPGATGGVANTCVTNLPGPRKAGGGVFCVSIWGAEDMIGNLWEWVADWHASPGNSENSLALNKATPWKTDASVDPGDYKQDAVWNVGSIAYVNGFSRANSPAAVMRGGGWGDGESAGLNAFYLGNAPSSWYGNLGFRCVIPR